MDIDIFKWLALSIAILFGLIILIIGVSGSNDIAEKAIKIKDDLVNSSNRSNRLKRRFDFVKVKLAKNGINYRFGRVIEPIYYFIVKIVTAVLIMIFGTLLAEPKILSATVACAVMLFVVGYILPDILIRLANNDDNDKMMEDISTLFATFEIQSHSNAFIDETIDSVSVSNPRLRQGLRELSMDIKVRQDIEFSLEVFLSKFNNQFLNNFVISLQQAAKTGQKAQRVADLSASIEKVEKANNQKKKDSDEFKSSLFNMVIYLEIIAVMAFILLSQFATSMSEFTM